MQFPVIIEKDKEGYYATCPALAGCSTQGATYEEAIANIQDAIKLYVQDCLEDKEIIMLNDLVSLQILDIPLKVDKK